VYHGLGNFVTLTSALALKQDNPLRSAWAEKRRKLFGFVPDPAMPSYPFHPDSRNTMIAVCDVDRAGVVRAGLLPCWIDQAGVPEAHGRDEVGERVARYFEEIGKQAGLSANYEWDGEQLTFWHRPR
jgi:poly-gamma-glutamate synthesis protein (capsule biosynthesis protein)